MAINCWPKIRFLHFMESRKEALPDRVLVCLTENGHAHGEDTMDITGKGLRASGNGWSFTESTEHGNHQLSLKMMLKYR